MFEPDMVLAVCAVVGVMWTIGAAITKRLQRIEEILTGLQRDTVTHEDCAKHREKCSLRAGISDHEKRLRALEKGVPA